MPRKDTMTEMLNKHFSYMHRCRWSCVVGWCVLLWVNIMILPLKQVCQLIWKFWKNYN